MTVEQLNFAFGASIPFIIFLFFYDKKAIFWAPITMTITGILAFLPYFTGWTGAWTNVFFLYNIIQKTISKGQFIGYVLIVSMFTIVLLLQALYLWRNKHA